MRRPRRPSRCVDQGQPRTGNRPPRAAAPGAQTHHRLRHGFIDGDEREATATATKVSDGRTPDGATIYEVGSVTKAFTGALLADMIERGDVKLDQPIAELCPKGVTPPSSPPLSRSLMPLASHTSGLPRLPRTWRQGPPEPLCRLHAQAHGRVPRQAQLRAQGDFEYSNSGAGLLGALPATKPVSI